MTLRDRILARLSPEGRESFLMLCVDQNIGEDSADLVSAALAAEAVAAVLSDIRSERMQIEAAQIEPKRDEQWMELNAAVEKVRRSTAPPGWWLTLAFIVGITVCASLWSGFDLRQGYIAGSSAQRRIDIQIAQRSPSRWNRLVHTP